MRIKLLKSVSFFGHYDHGKLFGLDIPWVVTGLVALAMLLPVVYLAVRSAGALDEVAQAVFRERTALALWRTAALIALVVALSGTTGSLLAWLTARTNLPLRRMVEVGAILPLALPSFILAMTLIELGSPKGLAQQWLAPFGVSRLPSIYGLAGATLVLTVATFPYVFLTVLSYLRRADPTLEEAARSLGVGRIAMFRRVTLPIIRPALVSGVLLVGLYTLSDYGAVALMRYETLTAAIFAQYQTSPNRILAAGLSLPLIAIALLLLGASEGFGRKGNYWRTGAGVARTGRVDLGLLKWVALMLAWIPITAGLLAPVGVLAWWAWRSVEAGLDWGGMAAINSVYIALLAAAVTTAVALPVASLSARRTGLVALLADKAALIGFGLPGVVVALTLVFVGINLVPFLYQSLWLLVAAYGILYMSPALAALKPSMLQINPHLEEVARSLGAAESRVFLKIVQPLIRPGIVSAVVAVFLLTMKELPATLLLSPPGFSTLATFIWASAEEAFFSRTGVTSLLLVGVAGLPAALLLVRRVWR